MEAGRAKVLAGGRISGAAGAGGIGGADNVGASTVMAKLVLGVAETAGTLR